MPLLTPDKSRFKPLGLLKNDRTGVVTLLLELATQQKRVARWFELPPGVSEVELLEATARLARSLKQLTVPNLPRFEGLVEGDGGTWMLFEWVEGVNFRRYIGAEATVPEDWIVWWLHELLETLRGLHTQVPPRSIGHFDPTDLVATADRLVLTDIGLFEAMFPLVSANTLGSHPFVQFIAPEQRLALSPTPGADLFSAAAIVFWLCTGYTPVCESTSHRPLLEALEYFRPNLPLGFRQLVVEMLAFHPGERPASADAAWHRLLPFVVRLRGASPPIGYSVADFSFAAEETRLINPPKPIFDAASGPDVRKPVVPIQGVVNTKLPLWRETLEDITWVCRRRPGLVAGWVALLGVCLCLIRTGLPSPGPAAGSSAWHIEKGRVLGRVPSGMVRYKGDWEPVEVLADGVALTTLDESARLKDDRGSTVWAGLHSRWMAHGKANGVPLVSWQHGRIRVRTSADEPMLVQLPHGTLRLEPGAAVTADVVLDKSRVACQAGQVTIVSSKATTHLAPGDLTTL